MFINIFHISGPERSEGQSNTISAVKSRGTRDERAGASPNGGPLYDWVVIGCFRLTQVQLFSRNSREARSPAGSVPCDAGKGK